MLLTLSDKQRLLLALLDYAALVGVGDRAAVPRLVEVVSALAVQAINAALTKYGPARLRVIHHQRVLIIVDAALPTLQDAVLVLVSDRMRVRADTKALTDSGRREEPLVHRLFKVTFGV